MAITLGEARQAAADIAHDASDAKADRVFMRWIRDALAALHSAHDWRHFQASQRLALDVEESGSDLTVTQGSSTVSRTTSWLSKYVTQAWDLLIEGDASQAFQLGEIDSGTDTQATLATGQVWLEASAGPVDYTLSRYRYSLPDNFLQRLQRVEDLTSQRELAYVLPAEMDLLRNRWPGRRSSQPECYTIRGAFLEVHPAPGTTRRALQLSYLRQVTLPTDAAADATELDWPAEYAEALWRGLELQAAAWGDACRISFPVAATRYAEALRRVQNRDSKVVEHSRQLRLTLPGEGVGFPRFYRNPVASLTDQA